VDLARRAPTPAPVKDFADEGGWGDHDKFDGDLHDRQV